MHKKWTVISAVFALVAALVVVPAAPASAHHALASSTPEAGDRLERPPTRVLLTFSFEVGDEGAAVEVVDEAGAAWTTGEPTLDGVHVAIDVDPDAREGNYQVRWSVISFDGATVEGVIPFSIGDAGPLADPLQAVIDPGSASLIRLGAIVLFGGLLGVVLVGLRRTYGAARLSRRKFRSGSGPFLQ